MKTYHFLLLLPSRAPGAGPHPREIFFAAPAIKAKAASPHVPPALSKEIRPGRTGQDPESRSPVIPAAYIGAQPPLGLRYSLLLSRANEAYREVDAASTFRSGDRLKITVESNDDAYLYVIARGSSGMWKVLFPVSEVANGDNLIQPFRRYEVPNGGRFFDDQAGEEKLFLVLSRKPEKNFEDLIYSITQPPPNPPNRWSVPRPARPPPRRSRSPGSFDPLMTPWSAKSAVSWSPATWCSKRWMTQSPAPRERKRKPPSMLSTRTPDQTARFLST